MTSRPSNHAPTRQLLDQRGFVDRIEEEIARCLRTRQHLSVILVLCDVGLTSATTLGPHSVLEMAQDVVRHVRRYDLAAVAGAAGVMLLFPLTTRENTEAILARLRRVTAPLPATRSWGVATWPADGGDSAAFLQAGPEASGERVSTGAKPLKRAEAIEQRKFAHGGAVHGIRAVEVPQCFIRLLRVSGEGSSSGR